MVLRFDLNLMAAFEALYEERSVTRAARRNGVTQPAMSNALARLRHLLGDPLFVRASGVMQPTPKAAAVAPTVAAALRSLREVANPAPFDPSRETGRFVVGTLDYIEALLLPPAVGEMRRAAPGARLVVQRLETMFQPPQAGLASGALDCALGFFPQALPPQSGLHGVTLRAETWVCIGRRDHPELAEPLTVERFAGLPQVGLSYPDAWPGGLVDRRLAERGLARRVTVVAPHFMTAAFLVAQSDAVACVPRRLAEQFAKILPLTLTEAPLNLPDAVRLIWSTRVDRDPAHQWFRRLLSDTLADPPYRS